MAKPVWHGPSAFMHQISPSGDKTSPPSALHLTSNLSLRSGSSTSMMKQMSCGPPQPQGPPSSRLIVGRFPARRMTLTSSRLPHSSSANTVRGALDRGRSVLRANSTSSAGYASIPGGGATTVRFTPSTDTPSGTPLSETSTSSSLPRLRLTRTVRMPGSWPSKGTHMIPGLALTLGMLVSSQCAYSCGSSPQMQIRAYCSSCLPPESLKNGTAASTVKEAVCSLPSIVCQASHLVPEASS